MELFVYEREFKCTDPVSPRFVRRYDEEYEALKKARRQGRPASTREDLLKAKIAELEKEYRDGFCEQRGSPPGRLSS